MMHDWSEPIGTIDPAEHWLRLGPPRGAPLITIRWVTIPRDDSEIPDDVLYAQFLREQYPPSNIAEVESIVLSGAEYHLWGPDSTYPAVWQAFQDEPRLVRVYRRGTRGIAASSTLRPGISPYTLFAERYLAIRFFHRGDPVQALREIMELEGTLPPALTGALLAASQCRLFPTTLPQWVAQLCTDAGSIHHPVPFQLLNSEAVQRAAREFLEFLRSGNDPSNGFPAPEDPLNRARVLVAAAKALWSKKERMLMGHRVNDMAQYAYDAAIGLAAVGFNLRGESTVQVYGQSLHLDTDYFHDSLDVWPQALEWDAWGGPSPEGLQFLTAGKFPIYDNLPATSAREELSDLDPSLMEGLAEGFLDEADRQGVYIPAAGAFTVALPYDYPLRRVGVRALRVWVQEQEVAEITFWVTLLAKPGPVASCAWRPRVPLSPFAISEDLVPLVQLTLAALYHDLRVAGPEVLPKVGQRRGSSPTATVETEPSSPRKRADRRSSRRLPAVRRAHYLGDTRQWGTANERKIIRQQRHAVRGHIRRLPVGFQVSEAARRHARLYGQVLPPDHTFVQPFQRGGGSSGDHDAVAETPITARGLATIMTHFAPDD